jgi:hypothetical protein
MKSKLMKGAFVSVVLLVAAIGAKPTFERETAQASVRFCCTPQQVAQCSAIGGTASCRTNVCQCLF